ncbi:GAF sensor signal transduction histidine kinase [Leptolyngbya boryana NIES-2135]|jgi:light-regulated signal transduction histidine kinase (bacteriophytochrome)|uniref:histidine kinase n=1 Tax=Leptolyngbya boryana NIES-2135 TaxID=1973484 RepID=A0A1Z4JAT5_LEPBY|nr:MULTISPECIES: GAF domain-containing protein [Leptolyngbya]BAY53895.1 GAF sensor signal transduction histidine kinase [Leptolyngbya boryana NIES-2135]MBD2370887.1 GAF domain-containing protein [Leptolyngbya sp. FACHB-161]MBD2377401.1 GAF domain-containing protein [Leptolyngbya sp. FACHB-238]MBD2401809.1 GAF domain-containing protein [Leptolyngbya sp. FACHB-239]MBD2408328.1 GAF domain-containing protein [Leptolyngbya sp. FACHB-402]
MDSEVLTKLKSLCRDEAAFEQLRQTLADKIQPLEQQINQANFLVERQKALFHVIARLREPLDLETIFQSTAAEVRQLLGADRVGVFRFYPDCGWNDGEFVSEDVDPEFSSAIAQKIHDHCFGDQFAAHYQQGRIQNVTDIDTAGLSDCHRQILAQFQVRANLVVPLLQGRNLWGLLCIHQCRAPRQWQSTEIEFVQQIANHLAVALQHAELLAELRAEVTERQQAEQRAQKLNQGLQQAILELKAVNAELEAFSYSVSHDLRAPLRSIDGFSQALLEDCFEQLDPSGQDYLRRIRSATQRMGHLIDDLLTLSRVTRSDMRKDTLDLSQVASRICTQLQQASPQRQIEVQVHPGLTAYGDTRLIQVVLDNLLNNAWKFTEKQAQAKIEFGMILQDNGIPLYFVRDNGVGFDPAFLDKLFKPFQRLHSMVEFPGNGVGLATVQRIIHRHGGRVWAEGALDQGATFYFTLIEEKPSA